MKTVRSLILAFLVMSATAFGQWTVQTTPTTNNLFEVHFVDTLVGWVVGQYGTMLRTSDGGETWMDVSSNFYSNYGNRVVFLDTPYTAKGWIAADGGLIMRTTNSGWSWSYESISSGSTNFYDMSIVRRDTSYQLYAVGGYRSYGSVVASSGNGTWSAQLQVYTGILCGITFVNRDTGFVVGNGGNMYKTTNGGSSWLTASSGTDTNLCSIKFFNDSVGVVVGDKGMIRKTTDGGSTWKTIQSGGDKVMLSVIVLGDSVAYAVGSNTTILVTADQGNTWTQEEVAGPTDRGMSGIFFVNGQDGWAVGSGGLILHTTHGFGKTGSKVQLNTAVHGSESTVPSVFSLDPVFPNPFNPETTINFTLAKRDHAELKVFDVLGKEVGTLVDGELNAGTHTAIFDGTRLASGVYFLRLTSGSSVQTVKAVLQK